MCHALLQDPNFFHVLLRIDAELADETRSAGCACGGVLHRADYPRKPRACLAEFRADFASRFSFCCSRCRRRTTAMSVRFLGRRVYLGLMVVLGSARHAGQNPAAARLAMSLSIPIRTLQRWRRWWAEAFPLSPLWQAACARFMPPVSDRFPTSLLERFVGQDAEAMTHLLRFLTPLTVRANALREGR